MTIYIPEIDPSSLQFPDPSTALADPNGLLAFGGDLSPQRLRQAYRHGIFPWYSQGEPILWWSPTPRGIFIPQQFTPSKSLRKFMRKVSYTVSINHACHAVIRQCAESRGPEHTWITEEMINAYQKLHDEGNCHSVEVWQDQQLVGGFYGIAVGSVFCGESMFSLADNASKIALWYFCHHFSSHGGTLIDCQMMNPHLASLGARESNRSAFLTQLHQQRDSALPTACYHPQTLVL